MKDFKGKKVLIMGLGLHGGGAGAARYFAAQGAQVLVTDLKSEEELKNSLEKLEDLDVEYHLGGHREEDFKEADLVLKNPDVPPDSPFLKKAKGLVKTDIEIFFNLFEGEIIGVTGTKGKSTTATLIHLFLEKSLLAGNIGVSPLELLLTPQKADKAVLELSSFELEELDKSPKIAVITNVLEDHLNRYKNFEDYLEAKKRIFLNQKKDDFLVLNYNDETTKNLESEASSQVFYFSREASGDCFVEEGKVYFKEEFVLDVGDIALKGKHNLSNVLAALTVAKILKVDNERIRKTLKDFKGLPHRQELVAEIGGVSYFNDTAATMPKAVISALDRILGDKIVLIAGGKDKGLDYGELAKKIKEKVSFTILLPGTGTDKLKKELEKISFSDMDLASSMEEAVKKTIPLKKDIVLLSPGAASFNLFKNEFDRGEQFKAQVKKLQDEKN